MFSVTVPQWNSFIRCQSLTEASLLLFCHFLLVPYYLLLPVAQLFGVVRRKIKSKG